MHMFAEPTRVLVLHLEWRASVWDLAEAEILATLLVPHLGWRAGAPGMDTAKYGHTAEQEQR